MKAQGHITVRRRPKDGADGRGILTVTTYYLASSASSGVTTSTSGWTTAIQEVTSAKRYLWTFTRTTYTAGSTVVDTTPAIIRVFADTGLTYRTSKYTVGVTYRNDNNPYYRDANGVGYIDIVYLNEISIVPSGNPASAFICNKTHTASAATPAVGELWTAMNTQQPIYTALLLTKKIIADYIDVDTLHVKHLDGADGTFSGSLQAASGTFKGVLSVYNGNNLVAKIGDTTAYSGTIYPFWIGGATPANAITKIDSTGILTTTKLVANGGSIGGFNIGTNYLGLSSSQGGAPSSNGMSLYQDFISFYEKSGTETVQALVGTSVLPASTGVRGLVSISAKETDSYASLTGSLYGLMINVSGYRNPYAIYCEEGVFAGFRPQISIENTGKTLTNMDSVVSCGNTSAVTFYLPTSPKHGQFYALIHSTETTMNITSSATHPIMRITKDGTTVVATTSSGSMEVVLLVYNAHATITYNSTTRTGVWSLTYLKV